MGIVSRDCWLLVFLVQTLFDIRSHGFLDSVLSLTPRLLILGCQQCRISLTYYQEHKRIEDMAKFSRTLSKSTLVWKVWTPGELFDRKTKGVLFETVLTVETRINACFYPLTRSLFLTCTEGLFIFIPYTHVTFHNITCNIMDYLNKETPYVEWLRIPILAGLLPRVNCPILRTIRSEQT
jgi:hypothetical protein